MKKHNMKPIADLMDESIEKLSKLVPKEHQMNCNTCGQIMDLRDLSQVFAHEDCNGIPIDYEAMEQIEHEQGVKITKASHVPEFSSPEFMEKYNKLKNFTEKAKRYTLN